MARFKHYDYGQMKLLPVSFKEQILPGTFEHTLNHLIDHEIDLSVFEHRYQNDETGVPRTTKAEDPAVRRPQTRAAKIPGPAPEGRRGTPLHYAPPANSRW